VELPLIDQITEKLHAEGGRMTNQRRLIVEALLDCADHPTAEEIYERVRITDSSIHLSTVYRTLRWLEEEGFVNPRWFEDERRQERFDPIVNEDEGHYHFRCRVCNDIVEFSEPVICDIKAAYETQFGGKVESATLTLYGVCKRCMSK